MNKKYKVVEKAPTCQDCGLEIDDCTCDECPDCGALSVAECICDDLNFAQECGEHNTI